VNSVTVLCALVFFYTRRVVNPLSRLTTGLLDLIAKKKDASIGYQEDGSEIGQLARSIEQYRVNVEEADRQHWVKSSLAEVSDKLHGADRPEEFGSRLLSGLVPHLNAGLGAFHILGESDGRYHPAGGYGLGADASRKPFAAGEGIAGQAVAEKKLLVISDVPAGYVKVGSALGEAAPRTLAAVPLITQDKAIAVLEIAGFAPLTREQRELLQETAAMAALKLDVLQRNLRTRELLEQVKLNEQRVREAEQFFRSVLEQAPDGLMVVDVNGGIVIANAQCERLFGYTREEFIGMKVEKLVPDEVRPRHPDLRADFHRSAKQRAMGAGQELKAKRK